MLTNSLFFWKKPHRRAINLSRGASTLLAQVNPYDNETHGLICANGEHDNFHTLGAAVGTEAIDTVQMAPWTTSH